MTKKIEEEINTVEGVQPHRVDLAGGPLEHRGRVPPRGLARSPPPRTCAARSRRSAASCRARSRSRSSSASTSAMMPIVSVGVERPRPQPPGGDRLRRQGRQAPHRERARRGLGRPGGGVDARDPGRGGPAEARGLPRLARRGGERPRGARTWTSRPAPPTGARPRPWCGWPRAGRTAADIAEIPVKRTGGMTVYVRDVAQVVDGVEEPKNAAFLDERPGARARDPEAVRGQHGGGGRRRPRGGREAARRSCPRASPSRIIKDDSTFIRESIEDVNITMIIGGLLTVFIVFLFLNSWRSTVITGLTLPISVVAGFIAMRAFGFTLNVLTLMGLSLAIGMLIDDAIVVRENIVRHLQRGKDHFDAARDGTAEIGLAVMATTFTIIAVFVPVAFMGGMVGRFFYEFGITVAAAVLASLFVSFTLDPMLSSRWVRPRHREGLPPALRRPDAAAVQRVVRRPAREVRAAARLVAPPSAGRARASPPSPSSAASRSSPSSAATSCPTSTAASTRCRSRRHPGRPSRRRASGRSRSSAG